MEFHGEIIDDPRVRRFSLGGPWTALLTDDEIVVDSQHGITRIRLDSIAGITVDDAHLMAKWLRIDYPGGPLAIETYGPGRQLHELLDEAMARIAEARRGETAPAAMEPRGNVVDELTRLVRLRDGGHLDDDEFQAAKRAIIGGGGAAESGGVSDNVKRTHPGAE